MAGKDVQIKIGAVDQTKAAFNSVSRSLSGLRSAVFSVQGAIAGVIGGAAIKGIVDINASFQQLQASLVTFTGSQEAANKQFEILRQFASKTPFSLQEVVGGFNILVARGINPTVKSFESFGNIAAGTGKTLNQFVEAVADAAVGEFERLKEFGIKASVEGDKVKMTFGGVTQTISKDSESILSYLEKLGQTKFAGSIERQSKTLSGAFSNFGDAVDDLAVTIGKAGLNNIIIELTLSLTGLISRFSEATKAGLGFAQAIRFAFGDEDLKAKFEKLKSDLADVDKQLTELGPRDPSEMSNPLRDSLEAQRIEIIKSIASVEKFIKAQGALTETTKEAVKPMGVILNEIQKFEGSMKTAVEPVMTFGDETRVQVNALYEYQQAIRTVSEEMQSMAVRGLQSLEDNLTAVIMGTKSAKDAFSDMARSIIADLIKIQIRKAIVEPLSGVLDTALGSIFPGSQMPFPARAMGGSVTAGQPYMVGEQGAELFVPGQTGTIVPNNKMAAGGVTVVQNINVTTGVQQTVRAEIMTLMPQIANAAKSAVADAKLRGGSYAAALR
jgi:hypothetical protein